MSELEQDAVIGKLVREHGERRKTFVALTAKLIDSGRKLQSVSSVLESLDASGNENTLRQVKTGVLPAVSGIDFTNLSQTLKEYFELSDQLAKDAALLRQYGV